MQSQPTKNAILARLPPGELEVVSAALEPVELIPHAVVHEPGDPYDYAHFLTSGLVSLLTVFGDGRSVEAAIVGTEGAIGARLSLGDRHASLRAVVQLPGAALRIPAGQLLELLPGLPVLQTELHRHVATLFTIVAYTAGCNRLHTVSRRCARWLLLFNDHAGSDSFPLTQEFVAQLLGVRRAGVSDAARALNLTGAIDYRRGNVTIKDRAALEAQACECYRHIRGAYRYLEGPVEGQQPRS
jgi:CRP-like cAMP-binding protein